MSLEPELDKIEMQLQQFAPVASAMDRDALFYRAGWEAANRQARGGANWLWPGTAAALAAALLLSLTLPPASPLQQSEISPRTTTLSAAQTTPSMTVSKQARVTPRVPALLKRYSPTASLLVMRERALREDIGELPHDTFASASAADTPAKTNRQLLEQYLPESKLMPAAPLPWWTTFRIGESS